MMRHDNGNGQHDNSKGQQGDGRHEDTGGGNNDAGGIRMSVILLSCSPGNVGCGE